MAKQTINVSTPNSGLGDPLRTAFTKINSNFSELYTALGLDAGGLNLGAFQFTGSVMTTTDSTPMVLGQAVSVTGDLTVGGDLLPNNDIQVNLGSPAKKWHSLYVGTGSVYIGNAKLSLEGGTLNSSVGFATDSLTIGGVALTINNAGQVEASTGFAGGVPANTGNLSFLDNTMYGFTGVNVNNADLTHGATAGVNLPTNGGTGTISVVNTYGDVQLTAGIGNLTKDLYFTGIGELDLPSDGAIKQNNTWTRSYNSPTVADINPTVVWTSTVSYISSAKLIIQVEAYETGDVSGWHSQTCEAVIAARGTSNIGPTGDPQMVVYGIVHTSVAGLATFTVQRNPITKMVEVVATLTGTVNGTAYLKIHSVEMGTRD